MLLSSVLSACGVETPPYSELPLRDALSASPEALAALPLETRVDLANRLVDEHIADAEDATSAEAMVPSAAALVQSADESREAQGKDAAVLAVIERGDEGFALRVLAVDAASEGTHELPVVEGGSEAPTKALEDAALRGRAGAIVAAIVKRSDADHIERVTGWPVGAVAVGDTVYVNATWLVALSALEPKGDHGAAPASVPRAPPWPGLAPQSIDINPYDLPGSVSACAADVDATCVCASNSSCAHEPTDPTFQDANAECAWVKAAPGNASVLCVLALLNITDVQACVELGVPSCTAVPVSDRSGAAAFVADMLCMSYLDQCLNGQKPTSQPSSSGDNGSSCNSCDSPDCDCDSPDCDNSSCNSCNSSSCNSCDSSDCKLGKCSAVSRRRPDSPGGTPLSPVLMALSFVYVLHRVRRRS
jgi:hypothetical protein